MDKRKHTVSIDNSIKKKTERTHTHTHTCSCSPVTNGLFLSFQHTMHSLTPKTSPSHITSFLFHALCVSFYVVLIVNYKQDRDRRQQKPITITFSVSYTNLDDFCHYDLNHSPLITLYSQARINNNQLDDLYWTGDREKKQNITRHRSFSQRCLCDKQITKLYVFYTHIGSLLRSVRRYIGYGYSLNLYFRCVVVVLISIAGILI